MHPPLDFSQSNLNAPTMTMNSVGADPAEGSQLNQDPLHDPTLGNTGIEIIRLNKKFDIFMKRFMRAEEDIKEVKQNFYRVMHCAFAKYEQGFKRKNEYLERRRLKRKEEIERGVAQELKKRGMAGELDDPLLHGGNDMQSEIGEPSRHKGDMEDSELSNTIVGTNLKKPVGRPVSSTKDKKS
jgi:hypothetical protein